MGITSQDERLAARLSTLESRFEALIVQDKPGSRAFTAGRIPFAGTTGVLTEDNDLVWDNTNKRLGLGVTAPAMRLEIFGTTDSSASLRLTRSDSGSRSIELTPPSIANPFAKLAVIGSTARLSLQTSSGEQIGIYDTGMIQLAGRLQLSSLVEGIEAQHSAMSNNAIVGLTPDSSHFTFAFLHAGGNVSIYSLNGSNHTTTEIADPSALFTPTAGNAGTWNIYWSAANTRYELENKRGLSLTARIWFLSAA